MPRPSRLLTPADTALLIISVLLLAQLFSNRFSGEAAQKVVITDHLGQHQSLDLHHDQTLTVHGAIGDSTIQVADERVRFLDSPCQNKLCIHSGWIKHGGETVACLPNRLSVQLARSANDDSGFDAINF